MAAFAGALLALLLGALAFVAARDSVAAAVLLGAVALGLAAWMALGAGAALAASLGVFGRVARRWK